MKRYVAMGFLYTVKIVPKCGVFNSANHSNKDIKKK
jgi:hypothetical protein